MSGPVPHTAFNAPLTERRAVAFASIPLAQLKSVSNAFGGSITNVFLAACTLSLRAWLNAMTSCPTDALLRRCRSRCPMPIRQLLAARAPSGNSPPGHSITRQVLTNLHTATERLMPSARSAEKISPTVDLTSIAPLIPPTVAHAGMRLYTRLGLRLAPICHGTILYISRTPCGVLRRSRGRGYARRDTTHRNTGLNITLISHDAVIDLSVCVCLDNAPAVNEIATGIAESLDVLRRPHKNPLGGKAVQSSPK